jgi:hypothetical protein
MCFPISDPEDNKTNYVQIPLSFFFFGMEILSLSAAKGIEELLALTPSRCSLNVHLGPSAPHAVG